MSSKLYNQSSFDANQIMVNTTNDPDVLKFSLPKNDKPYDLQFLKSQKLDLKESGLLNYKMIYGYEAIYSESDRIIECELSLTYNEYEELCYKLHEFHPSYSHETGDLLDDPPERVNLLNDWNVEISIGYCSDIFRTFLVCKGLLRSNAISSFTIIISGKDIANHADAVNVLKKFVLSSLYSITTTLKTSIALKHDIPSKSIKFSPGDIKTEDLLDSGFEAVLDKLSKTFDIEPISYYLKANECNDLLFYQYLQYYHCIEYYYPKYIGVRFKNEIKDLILTNGESSNQILKIDSILDLKFKKFGNFKKEVECLKDLFSVCLEVDSILRFIDRRTSLKKYYLLTKKYTYISPNEIIENSSISLDKIATRFYAIRNSIVHAKKDEFTITPSESNFDLLKNDIKLLKYIAEVIIEKNKT